MSAFSRDPKKLTNRLGVPAGDLMLVSLLLASSEPEEIKRGLQDVCRYLERGSSFRDLNLIAASVSRHIRSGYELVRRWAYKAAALIGSEGSLGDLYAALETEPNAENRSWIVAALFAIETERNLAKWINKGDYRFYGSDFELAARLYARTTFVAARSSIGQVDFESDPLVRKWVALLTGYDKILPDALKRGTDELDMVGNLAIDEDEEAVEYGVWALDKHKDGSPAHLVQNARQLIDKRGERVKRWVFQLISKRREFALKHRDLLAAGMTDNAPRVREGVANGISRLKPFRMDAEVVAWFEREGDGAVARALVDHMVGAARGDTRYRNALAVKYVQSNEDRLLRTKIKAAFERHSDTRAFFADFLKRFNYRGGASTNGGFLPLSMPLTNGDRSDLENPRGNKPIFIQQYNQINQMLGGVIMTNENNQKSSIIYGNVTNSAVNVDNMVASLNNAVSGSSDLQIRALERVVGELGAAFAADRAVDQAWKESILENLDKLAKSSDASQKRSRAGIVATLLKAAPAAISGVAAIVNAVRNLMPMIDQIADGG